jgi:WD40 repeat protein
MDFKDEVSSWDVETGEETTLLLMGELRSLTFSPDGTILAIGNYWGSISLWNPQSTSHELVLMNADKLGGESGHDGAVNTLAFNPSGTLLASGSWGDGTIRLWGVPHEGDA